MLGLDRGRIDCSGQPWLMRVCTVRKTDCYSPSDVEIAGSRYEIYEAHLWRMT
jgi:hypothetical protein